MNNVKSKTLLARTHRQGIRMLLSLCLLAPIALPALAQTSQPLEGTIMDAKGAVLRAAKVEARNEATGVVATATTDGQGHFSIASLAEGTYDVDAFAAGFRTTTKKGVHVGASQTESVSLTLQVGGATDDISVEADATHSVAAA